MKIVGNIITVIMLIYFGLASMVALIDYAGEGRIPSIIITLVALMLLLVGISMAVEGDEL